MRTLTSFLLACLLTGPAFGAFGGGTQWDIRTTGSNGNGGAFDPGVVSPGTDFSQQDSPQVSYTDLVIGGTTTQATSAAHPFGATSPGNFVNITAGAGCTVQRAEILSVSGVTATFDVSLGTAASTCTAALGGSLLTIGLAMPITTANNTIWVKSGTYSITSTIGVSGTFGGVAVIGYATTHGDTPAAASRPLVTTATNSVHIFSTNGTIPNGGVYQNLSLSSTAGTRGDCFHAVSANWNTLIIRNVKMDGCNHGINGEFNVDFTFIGLQMYQVEITNSGSSAIVNTNGFLMTDSYIHDNTGDGVTNGVYSGAQGNGTFYQFKRCIITKNANGINGSRTSTTAGWQLDQVTIAGNTSAGFVDSSTQPFYVQLAGAQGRRFDITNSVSYGNGTYGFRTVNTGANAVPFYYFNNAYGANSTANLSNFAAATGDVTLTADPFTNSASGDYSLNSTAGGGAAIKAAGNPGAFPGATTTGFLGIGAVQASSSGGSSAFNGAFAQ